MADKSLDECPIKDDVVGYAPEGVAARAEAILAGFPCQVFALEPVSSFTNLLYVFLSQCCSAWNLFNVLCLAEGVSCAGSQKGMGDVRTRLLREVFRVWDLLPKGLETQTQSLQSGA